MRELLVTDGKDQAGEDRRISQRTRRFVQLIIHHPRFDWNLYLTIRIPTGLRIVRNPTWRPLGTLLALEREASFIIACKDGNPDLVRTLLGGQEHLAWRRCVDVVRALINCGADVNETFDLLDLSTLEWAIWQGIFSVLRYLLSEGASQDNRNEVVCNPGHLRWLELELGRGAICEFFNPLKEEDYQDLAVVESKGWIGFLRAVPCVFISEDTRLMSLCASPAQAASPRLWNAMHHVVYWGNYAAFIGLLPYHNRVASMTDERGWTLLHIAASAGHYLIIRHLLWLDADPFARTMPCWSHMPEGMYGKTCTPQEVAAAQSSEREQNYLNALDLHLRAARPAWYRRYAAALDERALSSKSAILEQIWSESRGQARRFVEPECANAHIVDYNRHFEEDGTGQSEINSHADNTNLKHHRRTNVVEFEMVGFPADWRVGVQEEQANNGTFNIDPFDATRFGVETYEVQGSNIDTYDTDSLELEPDVSEESESEEGLQFWDAVEHLDLLDFK